LSSGRAVILVVLALSLAASGCSAFKKKKPELAFEERPVELLYDAGATRLDHHEWSEAADYFHEVERQHPYSEWSRRAILMTAYAHYMANDYAEAIADSERFISLYPGNISTPYAYYLKAICYFEQIVDVGRDQASASEAGEALREVVKRYPTSEYATDARLKIDMVNDQLAGKEMTVGRYYLRAGDPMGAIGRFQTVVNKYQTTSHTPEALYRLVEAYLTVGLVEEAKRNGAVLGYNYPGDPWYLDAYNLLTDRGYRPATPFQPGGRRGPVRGAYGGNPFGHPIHKEDTLPPPADETAPPAGGDQTTDNTGVAAPPAATAPQPSPPAKQAPPKQGGFIHGVLGL
jgi:outer membrane protein assembly factor BamD